MSRLPNPGSDDGQWGDILNTFLEVAHNTDGTLKDGIVSSSKLDSATQTSLAGAANAVQSVNSHTGASVTVTASDVGLGNVDNTSDATKNAATATLTNKTISGASNTLSNIPESAVTNLTSDLAAKTSTVNGGGETYFDAGSSGTAITLNLANGNVQKLTLTGNCTVTLTSPTSGAYRALLLLIFQDATGSRTITWPAAVKWGTLGAPALSTTATKMDQVMIATVDGGTTWYGTPGPGGF